MSVIMWRRFHITNILLKLEIINVKAANNCRLVQLKKLTFRMLLVYFLHCCVCLNVLKTIRGPKVYTCEIGPGMLEMIVIPFAY